jgi:hypothetical protein
VATGAVVEGTQLVDVVEGVVKGNVSKNCGDCEAGFLQRGRHGGQLAIILVVIVGDVVKRGWERIIESGGGLVVVVE